MNLKYDNPTQSFIEDEFDFMLSRAKKPMQKNLFSKSKPKKTEDIVITPSESKSPEVEPIKVEPLKVEPPKIDFIEAEPTKPEPSKVVITEPEPAKPEPSRVVVIEAEPAKSEPSRVVIIEAEPAKPESLKAKFTEVESAKHDPVKVEVTEVEPAMPAPIKAEFAEAEPLKQAPLKIESLIESTEDEYLKTKLLEIESSQTESSIIESPIEPPKTASIETKYREETHEDLDSPEDRRNQYIIMAIRFVIMPLIAFALTFWLYSMIDGLISHYQYQRFSTAISAPPD